MAAPLISLIIPAFNEEQLLPRLLDSVDRARETYARGRDAVEVIVADNGSVDATAEIAARRGCRVVPVVPHIIAAVRNGGAAAARGEILAFIDADSLIDPKTFDALEATLAKQNIVAGTTGVRPDRWSIGLAVTFAVAMPLFALLKIDTGVVFCRREDFEKIGGYNENLKFAEDIRFLWDLRRLGKERGQKLTRLRQVKATTSTRKFDRCGTTFPSPCTSPGVASAATRASTSSQRNTGTAVSADPDFGVGELDVEAPEAPDA